MKRDLIILGDKSPKLPIGVGIIRNFPLGLGVLIVLEKEHANRDDCIRHRGECFNILDSMFNYDV